MTVHLERIVLREIRLPLVEPFRISSGVETTRRILLAELVDVDGVACWSECVAGARPNYSPETVDTCWWALTEWLAPRVLDRPFRGPEALGAALSEDLRGHQMAQAVLEMGAWGLTATRREISLAKLIGGERPRIETGISLGIQESPEVLVGKASRALDEGYRKIKIKVRPGADLAFLGAVREALGREAPLMADANNAYREQDFDHLARWDELGLLMIEQPLAWDDVVRHAALQARLATPICLDESITSVDRVRDMVELDSGRIVNLKPGRVGGFGPSLAIHAYCRERGIPLWCGGMLESGIGRAYNVALASLPGFTLPGDVSPSRRYWERDVVTPEWTMSAAGEVEVPRELVGLGVEPDRDRIEDLTVRETVLE